MPKRRLSVLLLRLAFSVAVLAAFLLIKKTSFRGIGLTLGHVSWGWLAVAFSLHALGLLVSAYRWQILARAQGDDVPLAFLAKSYLVGTFFNNFLPTRFGGDVVRIFDGSGYSRSLVKSSAIVMVERATGITVLFLFAVTASAFRLDMARRIPVIWIALLLGLAGLAAAGLFFSPAAERILGAIPRRGFLKTAAEKTLAFRKTILFYGERRSAFGRAMAWAVLLQLNVIVYYFLIGRGLHLAIGLLDYFIFIPLVLLLQIIPVTINGLGLREAAYIEIFNFYGIPSEAAVSFSIVEVVFGLAVGLVGGAIYISRK